MEPEEDIRKVKRLTSEIISLEQNTPQGMLLKKVLGVLQKLFGKDLYVDAPEHSLFNLKLALSLKKLGLLESVSQVEPPPDEPFMWKFRAAPHSQGDDFFSKERALSKALGECLERGLWRTDDKYIGKIHYSSFEKIRRSFGEAVLDPDTLVGFSREQKQTESKLEVKTTHNFGWIQALSLLDNKKGWYPAQLFSAKFTLTHKEEQILRTPTTNGLGTGPSLTYALLKGLLEIIERDAFMVHYLNRSSVKRINHRKVASEDPDLNKVFENIDRHNLEPILVRLPTDIPVNVVLCILEDKTGKGPRITLGARADTSLTRCIKDSLSEAVSIRAAHREDWNKPVTTPLDRKGRIRYWAQGNQYEKLSFMMDAPYEEKATVAATDDLWHDHASQVRILEKITDTMKKQQMRVAYTILTEPSWTEECGVVSVSVVSPDMHPLNLDERYPYFDRTRINALTSLLELTTAENINTQPHPFP